MRKIRKVSDEEAGFGTKEVSPGVNVIKQNPVEAEPVGTVVLLPFVITGYDPDCDGSLMARLKNINLDGQETGWEPSGLGLDEYRGFVTGVTEIIEMSKEMENKNNE
jgi:hypothetical protein